MRTIVIALAAAFLVMTLGVVPAHADEEGQSAWPPMPGVALKTGGGLYHSIPCGCFDRGMWSTELSGRLHFGDIGALESGVEYGAMLLGGNFPSQGWSVGGRVSILPQKGRWWDGLSLRSGYRRLLVMGTRPGGIPGVYASVNWSVQVFSHLYIETDLLVSRTFRTLRHWELGGRMGVATRF